MVDINSVDINSPIAKMIHFNKKKHHIEDWMTSSILKSIYLQ